MAVIKCKMCGGNLKLTEGSLVAECEYCGSVQTVPALDDEKKLVQFERAERLRKQCEFDKAAGIYEAIVADYRQEAEAYWGLVLCKYGIEYVDDPATGKKIPTCHRSSYNSILEDADYEQALENVDSIARKIYREEAKQIEELRKDILEVSKNEEPYDIFICYKETAADGQRTLDSVLAQDIYEALTQKKYRVFFARITLEDKLGQEYEPYIFAALNSAKVMLAVGTDYEHFNAVWVRNEWSRYLKLMEGDKDKHLIPCFKGIDAYDMPKEFAKLQAQDLGKVGAVQDLLRGIDKLITPAATTATPTANAGANVAELLEMGNQALENAQWKVASSRFDLALVADPKNAEAYIGKLLAEYKFKSKNDLTKSKKRLDKSNHFLEAMSYADECLKKELEEYSKAVTKKRRKIAIRRSVAAVLVAAIAIAGLLVKDEIIYRNTIKNYYSGTATAKEIYNVLSQMENKEPDDFTKFILRKALRGTVYPEVADLTELTIPDNITGIGAGVFYNSVNLITVHISDSVTQIGADAFNGCRSLVNINLPAELEALADDAFNNCDSLVNITIPDGVTSIGNRVFYGCNSLSKIVIPETVTQMGSFVFGSDAALEYIYCEAEQQPEGWDAQWAEGTGAQIIWGYIG